MYLDFNLDFEMRKKMKKLFTAMGVLALLSMPAMASEPIGFIYQDTTHQLLGSSAVAPAKTGVATCTQYFGVVALGNCSIKKAMANGKINALSYADQQTKNILGYKKVTTRVYGQ